MKIKIIVASFLFNVIIHASQETALLPAKKQTTQTCVHLDVYIPISGIQQIILGYLNK